jgi:hypothetical protein
MIMLDKKFQTKELNIGMPEAELLCSFSLGSHLMGKAGRVYQDVIGQKIARITGLDPAGPRFVDGPLVSAIPELNENRLRSLFTYFLLNLFATFAK